MSNETRLIMIELAISMAVDEMRKADHADQNGKFHDAWDNGIESLLRGWIKSLAIEKLNNM